MTAPSPERDRLAQMRRLLEAMVGNEPEDMAADAITCWMVWKREAAELLAAFPAIVAALTDGGQGVVTISCAEYERLLDGCDPVRVIERELDSGSGPSPAAPEEVTVKYRRADPPDNSRMKELAHKYAEKVVAEESEAAPLTNAEPEYTTEQVVAHHGDPAWEAIWQTIKRWDICRGDPLGNLYAGATGDDVTRIYDAIQAAAPVAVVGREISTGRAVEEIEDAADNYFEQPLNGDRMGFTIAVRAIVEARATVHAGNAGQPNHGA